MTEETKKTEVAKKTTTKKVNNDELIEKHNQMIQFIKNTISGIDTDLKRIKLVLNKLAKFNPNDKESLNDKAISDTIGSVELKSYKEEDIEVVE